MKMSWQAGWEDSIVSLKTLQYMCTKNPVSWEYSRSPPRRKRKKMNVKTDAIEITLGCACPKRYIHVYIHTTHFTLLSYQPRKSSRLGIFIVGIKKVNVVSFFSFSSSNGWHSKRDSQKLMVADKKMSMLSCVPEGGRGTPFEKLS